MAIAAVVLAAGASRRLGHPKQLVRVAGETLLARTIRLLIEAEADPVVVVLGAYQELILAQVDLGGAYSVINASWEQGIASSMHRGIAALQSISPVEAAILAVCDQPRLSAEHLRSLIKSYKRFSPGSIVASRYAGVLGIPAIFPANSFDKLLSLKGDQGAKALLADPESSVQAVDFDGGEIDIDTPADME